MAEAIFASEQVKELPLCECAGTLGLLLTIVARLSKYFLMRNCPGNTSHRDGQDEQASKLETDRQD